MAPELGLMPPRLVPQVPAVAMHFKDDGVNPVQVDLEDYLQGDRRSE
jgi:hypothetical protein